MDNDADEQQVPTSFEEATGLPDWKSAIEQEVEKLQTHKVFALLEPKKIPPELLWPTMT